MRHPMSDRTGGLRRPLRCTLSSRVCHAAQAAIIQSMHRLTVYLTVIGLVVVALAVGWVASDWPHWCRMLNWCDGQGLL